MSQTQSELSSNLDEEADENDRPITQSQKDKSLSQHYENCDENLLPQSPPRKVSSSVTDYDEEYSITKNIRSSRRGKPGKKKKKIPW